LDEATDEREEDAMCKECGCETGTSQSDTDTQDE
jgi:hypothetical protein